MNKSNNDFTGQEANAKLLLFFIQHLNSIYSAKSHLVVNLPLLRDLVEDENLLMGIEETIDNVEKQIARMEIIYSQLDTSPPEENTIGLKGLIDEAFLAIQEQSQDPMLRDMCILFYLQNIENVEVASFQLLRMAAVKLNTGQVGQLLKDNFEEAKKNRTLLLLISAKYITSASNND